MSITQDGTRTTRINSTATTSCSVPIPTGLTTAHYMVLAVSIAGNKVSSLTTPAGWTPIGSPAANGTSVTLALWGKFWASGDTAPAPSWTSTNKNSGTIVPFLGVDPTTPIDSTVSAFLTGSSTTPTDSADTATTRGAARLHVTARAVGGSSTPDPQMVEATDISTSTPNPGSLSFDYQLGMAEGATGTRSNTTSSGAWVSAAVWLRPATPDSFGLLQVRSTTTSTPNTPDTLAFANPLTVGSTLAVKVASFFPSAAQTSVTYPGGTFTQYAHVNTTNTEVAVYLFQNNQRTTADTVSVSFAAACDAGIVVEEWLGPPTTGTLVDQTGTNSGTTGTGAWSATASTTSTGEKLGLHMVGVATTQTAYTFDASYVQRGSQLSNTHMAWAAESGEFAGGAAETVQITLSTSSEWASSLVVLNLAGSGSAVSASGAMSGAATVSGLAQLTRRSSPLSGGVALQGSSSRATRLSSITSSGRGTGGSSDTRTSRSTPSTNGHAQAGSGLKSGTSAPASAAGRAHAAVLPRSVSVGSTRSAGTASTLSQVKLASTSQTASTGRASTASTAFSHLTSAVQSLGQAIVSAAASVVNLGQTLTSTGDSYGRGTVSGAAYRASKSTTQAQGEASASASASRTAGSSAASTGTSRSSGRAGLGLRSVSSVLGRAAAGGSSSSRAQGRGTSAGQGAAGTSGLLSVASAAVSAGSSAASALAQAVGGQAVQVIVKASSIVASLVRRSSITPTSTHPGKADSTAKRTVKILPSVSRKGSVFSKKTFK